MNLVLRRTREVLDDMERQGIDVDFSQQTLWKLRNDDKVVPSTETIARIAEASGASCDWLILGRGEKYSLAKGADAIHGRGVQEGFSLAIQVLRRAAAEAAETPTSAARPVTIGEIANDLDVAVEESRAKSAKPSPRVRRGKRIG